MSVNFKSHKAEWLKKLEQAEFNKLEKVGYFLTAEIKKTLGKKGTGRIYKVKTDAGYITHRASAPGRYPATLFGKLKQSIAHKVDKSRISVFIGVFKESAAAPYARRLELGFVGSDSKGRFYRQAPRPYLRPALHIHKNEINRLLKS